MAYQLQPGLSLVQNPAVPPVKATDEVFVYPQPSSLGYCCRPSTVLYGTAPYKAGKGAPAEYVEISDQLRPQSTSFFKKPVIPTYEMNLFPLQKINLPQRAMTYEPSSTRAELQNGLFDMRYNKKYQQI